MASKYYVVWVGKIPGVYRSWAQCKAQVHQYPGARYKSFTTEAEAEAALSRKPLTVRKPKSRKKAKPSKNKKKQARAIKTYDEIGINSLLVDTKVFTDGACIPNPGEAGSGIAVYRGGYLDELWYGLYDPNGTNNTAELNALHQGFFLAADEVKKGNSVAVITDSKYSLQCIAEWAASWEKNGWKKKGEGSIKNLDLIKPMYGLFQTLINKIEVLHVNGHVGIEGNELADRMSMVAIAEGDTEFVRFTDDMDVSKLLALRSG